MGYDGAIAANRGRKYNWLELKYCINQRGKTWIKVKAQFPRAKNY